MGIMNVDAEKEILLSELHKLSKPARHAVKKILIAFEATKRELEDKILLSLQDLPGEEWRDIEGFEGLYQISNCGRVKSFKCERTHIMKPANSGNGYLIVDFKKDGKRTRKFIHRLVALAFIENVGDKSDVNHIDGNKQNNRVENLEWATRSENVLHAFKNKLMPTFSGTETYIARLTVEQVRYIRAKYIPRDVDFGVEALAQKFNVGKTTIRNVIDRKSYKNVI